MHKPMIKQKKSVFLASEYHRPGVPKLGYMYLQVYILTFQGQRWSRDTLLRDRDKTRLWSIEIKKSTRLYISCFGLSQGCGVRVGSRSRMFLFGVGTEVVF